MEHIPDALLAGQGLLARPSGPSLHQGVAAIPATDGNQPSGTGPGACVFRFSHRLTGGRDGRRGGHPAWAYLTIRAAWRTYSAGVLWVGLCVRANMGWGMRSPQEASLDFFNCSLILR